MFRAFEYRNAVYRSFPSNAPDSYNFFHYLPLAAHNGYRVGTLRFTAYGLISIPSPYIYIMNDDYEGERLNLSTGDIALMTETNVLKYVESDGVVLTGNPTSLTVDYEPLTNGFLTTDARYIKYFNAAGPVTRSDLLYMSDADIQADPNIMSTLANLIIYKPVFSTTGAIYKYGIQSLLNLLKTYKQNALSILPELGIPETLINDLTPLDLPVCWRVKDGNDIIADLQEFQRERLISKYNLPSTVYFSDLLMYYIAGTLKLIYGV